MPDTNAPAPATNPPAIAAVEFPIAYKSALGSARLRAVQREAEVLLGANLVYVRNLGPAAFITADHRCSMYFPKWHEKAGLPRYHWRDRGDGVKLGTLVEGAKDMVGMTDPREEAAVVIPDFGPEFAPPKREA